MYNYSDIKYDKDWYKDVYEKFLAQDWNVLKKEGGTTSWVVNKYLKYTTSHGRTKINPLVFVSGSGPFLIDEDDGIYLDFGSGIYVTNLGHSHPKVCEAISIEAKKLMNCHDYLTPVKATYFEKLSHASGGEFDNIHLYDNGTTAVEFAIKTARAITGKYEIISCFSDHHGKSAGSASLGRISSIDNTSRLPGYYLVPRPNPFRPIWVDDKGLIDIDAYFNFYDLFIKESTTGQIAAFIIEPIQGWGGCIIPPDDFFPKLKKFCNERGMLLIVDEVLTGCGRTGKWLCTDHWNVQPDIVLMGKGIGNGFPMSAMLTSSEYSDTLSKLSPSTTYGGNPMACGAGLATLEVYEEEKIIDNSTQIGANLLAGLMVLKDKYTFIGDVRGKGSLLAIEFVKDRISNEPFNEVTELFYNECLKRRLIPGIPVVNLIRIAPTLNVDDILVNHALSIMDESLNIVSEKIAELK